jgi:hypothetical protein
MFKSPAQRFAFFAALKKKKAGMDNPAANSTAPVNKPIKLENIGQPPATRPQLPIPGMQPQTENMKPQIPKFGKIKKLMKLPKV